MKRHLKMDSDTDSTNSETSCTSCSPFFNKLGKCEVCNHLDAKYTCPKCEVKTCCLQCLNIHKKELNCNGIRDRTKYIPLNKMTKLDFMSDYNFLEECTRYVEDRKSDKIKRYTRYNKTLPTRLYKLRAAALERKIQLRFLLENFTKRKVNTTFYGWKEKCIYWRVEWIFINAGNLQYVDARCSENDRLSKLLDKYLNPKATETTPIKEETTTEAETSIKQESTTGVETTVKKETENNNVPMKKSLEYYQSKGLGNIKILLKAEGVKKCKNRFYLMDCRKTLKENLYGKTIVEFPTFYLSYDEGFVDSFDIIDSDDDVEAEAKQYRTTLDEIYRKQLEENDQQNIHEKQTKTEEQIQDDLKKLEIEKKRKERLLKRKELEKEPQNYLFANERLLDILSSDDDDDENSKDDGNETEEEKS